MESSIAVFLMRLLACELLPTMKMSRTTESNCKPMRQDVPGSWCFMGQLRQTLSQCAGARMIRCGSPKHNDCHDLVAPGAKHEETQWTNHFMTVGRAVSIPSRPFGYDQV